jgi:hypothetical protein
MEKKYVKRNEAKIRKAFARAEMHTWSGEMKGTDSWHVSKVMSEFVEGFERLSSIGPCVSIFGSARTKESDTSYKLAEEIAFKLTERVRGYLRRWRGYYGGGK